jgi:uncharacterized membrane protein
MDLAHTPALVLLAIAFVAGLVNALAIFRRDGPGVSLLIGLVWIALVCTAVTYRPAHANTDLFLPIVLALYLVSVAIKNLGFWSRGSRSYDRAVYTTLFGKRFADRIEANDPRYKNLEKER